MGAVSLYMRLKAAAVLTAYEILSVRLIPLVLVSHIISLSQSVPVPGEQDGHEQSVSGVWPHPGGPCPGGARPHDHPAGHQPAAPGTD